MSPDLSADEVRRRGAKSNEVEFTQFLFPDGKRKPVWIELNIGLAAKAKILKEKGFKFEIENKNGFVWMTIIHKTIEDQSLDDFVMNGPQVPKRVASLIEDAFEAWGKR